MIRNVVLVKLKAEADAAEVAEIQDGFRNLDCPGTVSYTLGDDLGLRDGTWNFAIVADFTDVASYRAYDLDAAHNRYRARLGPLAEQIARVQFELPGGLPADEPAGMAAAPASGLANPAEAVGLEELDGAHVTAGLVDAPAVSVDRVAFQRDRAHRVRVLDRAIEQLVHKSAAPEPRPHHEADHRPRALVLDVRDRS